MRLIDFFEYCRSVNIRQMPLFTKSVVGPGGFIIATYISDGRIITIEEPHLNGVGHGVTSTRRIYIAEGSNHAEVKIYDAFIEMILSYRVRDLQSATVVNDAYKHLLTSTTPFYHYTKSTTIYARSQVWFFKNHQLRRVVPVIPAEFAEYFDFNREFIVEIISSNLFRVHQYKGRTIFTYDSGQHYLVKYPPELQILVSQSGLHIFYNTKTNKTTYNRDGLDIEIESGHEEYCISDDAYAIVDDRLKDVNLQTRLIRELRGRIVEYSFA